MVCHAYGMEIIRPGTWVDLVVANDVGRVMGAMERAILQSYVKHPFLGGMSDRENKRRIEMLVRWIPVLRKDLGWSTERVLDAFPHILSQELSGTRYVPDETRSMWAATE
jgi:hypothetical protein